MAQRGPGVCRAEPPRMSGCHVVTQAVFSSGQCADNSSAACGQLSVAAIAIQGQNSGKIWRKKLLMVVEAEEEPPRPPSLVRCRSRVS